MIFGRDGESSIGKDICASYTTLPGRRMSTQSLICEAPSIYPSVPRRQGSLCHLDKLTYESYIAQVSFLSPIKIPFMTWELNVYELSLLRDTCTIIPR